GAWNERRCRGGGWCGRLMVNFESSHSGRDTEAISELDGIANSSSLVPTRRGHFIHARDFAHQHWVTNMTINFIPNDPQDLLPPMRTISPRADRPSSRAGFTFFAQQPEDVYDPATAAP